MVVGENSIQLFIGFKGPWRQGKKFLCVMMMLPGLVTASVYAQSNKESVFRQRKIQVVRFKQNPIIHPGLSPTIGNNINGPSLIEAPSWLPNRLGKYYLYFSHHHGHFIRLAYADHLPGPWRIYEPGTLQLKQTVCTGHIASPDVLVDNERNEIRMYFHGPVGPEGKQVSFVAISKDGIHFKATAEILGKSYFRVFYWNGVFYALARSGVLYRSADGLKNFTAGCNPFRTDSIPSRIRHVAVKVDGDTLKVFCSRIGDKPESILMSEIKLTPDWRKWRAAPFVTVLSPEKKYEGADLPMLPSFTGKALKPLQELRDPAIFCEGKKCYLLFSVAGEQGIAISELKE